MAERRGESQAGGNRATHEVICRWLVIASAEVGGQSMPRLISFYRFDQLNELVGRSVVVAGRDHLAFDQLNFRLGKSRRLSLAEVLRLHGDEKPARFVGVHARSR